MRWQGKSPISQKQLISNDKKMKVTPLEIRQKSFEKVFRGYDKDEVTAFLQTLSQEWERMVDDYKEMKFKLESSQDEIRKLREVESSLFKTLKTAEDTGSNMIEQAKRTADLHMKETQMRAEAVINESRSKAKSMIENAEHKTRQIIESMEDEVKTLEQTYKMLENYRDNMISDLRNIADNTLEKVERINSQKARFSIEEYINKSRKVSESLRNEDPFDDETEEYTVSSTPQQPFKNEETAGNLPDEPREEEVHESSESDKNKDGGSFFDQIN